MIYKHYKGGLYRVLMHYMDEESGKPHVLYISLQDGKLWGRNTESFNGTVTIKTATSLRTHTTTHKRFTLVANQ